VFKARQKLGKYRIERLIGEGGFAMVYQALDTIEGTRVALKIPHARLVTKESLEDFRREVRLAARLDHPRILPLKNASFIDGHFVIVFTLGERTLDERMRTRISARTALDYVEQMLEAVAYAHAHRIIHCDVKPDNFIIFPGDQLRLTDFGIAKVALRTIRASGSGTVGYVAPEQAMGKPSFRSDVFSLGLMIYRMFSGKLPEWPFDWPPPGIEKLRARLHPDMIKLIRRSIEVDPRKRFESAVQMLGAFRRVKARAASPSAARRARSQNGAAVRDWKTVRRRQFMQQYGKLLDTRFKCCRCDGPVSESMQVCPWCGEKDPLPKGETAFPAQCTRCKRGMKLDWVYCPWCYGPGYEPHTSRELPDKRYQAKCSNPQCTRKVLMPFMRYCPWCRSKVRRKWKIPEVKETCSSCGWGALSAFWSHCPWCGKRIEKK